MESERERVQVAAGGEGGGGAVTDGGRDLSDALRAAVARDEYAGRLREAGFVGRDETALVEFADVLERLVVGHLSDGDEHAVEREHGFLVFGSVLDPDPGQFRFAEEFGHDAVADNLHVLARTQDLCEADLARELGQVLDDRDGLRGLGEEHGVLKCGVAAADHGDVLALVEIAVAEGAVGDTAPYEIVFAGQTERPVARTGGDDDRLAEVFRPVGRHGFDLAVVVDGRDRVEFDLGAVVERLVDELLAEFAAGEFEEPRVVFDLRRIDDLPPERLLFEDEDGFPGAPCVNGGGESGRTGPDDDDVNHARNRSFSSCNIEVEFLDLKPKLDLVVVSDEADYILQEVQPEGQMFSVWQLTINSFVSDRVLQKINAVNETRYAQYLKKLKDYRDHIEDNQKKGKKEPTFTRIDISDEGLETIEWLSLDCEEADINAPWQSSVEVKIDKAGNVIRNGKKTNTLWDGTIATDDDARKPLRLMVRNICGDETIFTL